jgi:hypothetical protein
MATYAGHAQSILTKPDAESKHHAGIVFGLRKQAHGILQKLDPRKYPLAITCHLYVRDPAKEGTPAQWSFEPPLHGSNGWFNHVPAAPNFFAPGVLVDYKPEPTVCWTVCELPLSKDEAALLREFLESQNDSRERRTWFWDSITGACFARESGIKTGTLKVLASRAKPLRPVQEEDDEEDEEEEEEHKTEQDNKPLFRLGDDEDEPASPLSPTPPKRTETRPIVISAENFSCAVDWSLPEIVMQVLIAFGFVDSQRAQAFRPAWAGPHEIVDFLVACHARQHTGDNAAAEECGECKGFRLGTGTLKLNRLSGATTGV